MAEADTTKTAEADVAEKLYDSESPQPEQSPDTEQPTDDAAVTEEETKTAEAEATPEGAPEVYDFQAPDGEAFDDVVLEAFSDTARKLNLTQDAAQSVIDAMAPVIAERAAERDRATRDAWVEEAKADPDFGGDAFDENLAVAKSALDKVGSPELSRLLAESGLGDNVHVLKLFHKVGSAIAEERFFLPGGGHSAPQTAEEQLYPTMHRQKQQQ